MKTKTIAIIGTTASGKSDQAHKLAQKTDSVLLSMDSLAVFETIDIASAKPSFIERSRLDYFGLDIVPPCGSFGVNEFFAEFERAKQFASDQKRNLIIVGGSSFYLKALIDGISPIPTISDQTKAEVKELIRADQAYKKLQELDSKYASKISPNDTYRTEKALLIRLSSDTSVDEWFSQNPPIKLSDQIGIYEVSRERSELVDRIKIRTKKMLEMGLIDEVAMLEKLCDRNAQALKAIGIVEVLDYFDGKIQKNQLAELISTHTAQYAKRQSTFNRGQFEGVIRCSDSEFLDQAQRYLS